MIKLSGFFRCSCGKIHAFGPWLNALAKCPRCERNLYRLIFNLDD